MKKIAFISILAFLFNFSLSYAEIIQPQYAKEFFFTPDGKQYVISYGDYVTIRSINEFSCKLSTNSVNTIYVELNNTSYQPIPVKYGNPITLKSYHWTKPYGVPEYYYHMVNNGCSITSSSCLLNAGVGNGNDIIIQCNNI